MMSIPFVQPEQSEAEEQRAADLVDQMTKVVTWLTKIGADNKFRLITAQQRAELAAKGISRTLLDNMAFFTEQVRVKKDNGFEEQDLVMSGFTSNAFFSELYGSDGVRRAIQESHKGRCAYCESLINDTAYGDVEHFRPKAGYTTAASPALFRPGYYMLAYDPTNLFLSCQLCNQAFKENEFPVFGDRVPAVSPSQEMALLINPYTEDPRQFIRFDPMNGAAYPFDLVSAFYSKTKGWGPQQVEQEIWKDPTLIPGQTTYNGQLLSNQQVDASFQDWIKTQTNNPLLSRGIRTISILNLNRKALVRARVAHLRQVRGVLWAANNGSGTDQSAAQQYIQNIVQATPSVAVVPEYVSLSIDAANTWKAGPTSFTDWIKMYNAVTAAFIPKENLLAPPTHNDALIYIVLERDVKVAGKRRMIYITDKDKIYGNPAPNEKAVMLAVDWDAELENKVLLMKAGKVVVETTLQDLILDNGAQLWRIFTKFDVWVLGDFAPFKS